MLHVQNRELVMPGQLLAEGGYIINEGAFREGGRVYASVVGLADIHGQKIRVIPLRGRYIPKHGDIVIGVVIDTHYSGWILDLNSPYVGNLFVSDLLRRKVDLVREDIGQYLGIGDVVVAKIKDVNELMRVQLEAGEPSMGRVAGGKLVEVVPTKVPRIIGRKGSMLNVLQSVGGCRLTVGQNGRVMIWGDDPRRVNAVIEALLMIEREAHTSGLTDRVRLMLEKVKSEGGE
ncbi:MAG: exosome complex RNA-binding protein Rrp4 [Candidatus Hodarchaeaceae archaeon]|nr:exosome complex RNA-binding protein Rrp4 [Candidatus Hodarchaeaceae archaeon]